MTFVRDHTKGSSLVLDVMPVNPATLPQLTAREEAELKAEMCRRYSITPDASVRKNEPEPEPDDDGDADDPAKAAKYWEK